MGLRIGINALYLIPGGVGGTEIYLREMLKAFARQPRDHQFIVFLNRETGPDLAPDHPSFRVHQTGVQASNRPRRIVFEQTSFLSQLREHAVEVLYNPGFTSPLAAPLLGPPNVTVIHDLQHKRHPEYFKPADLLAWRLFVWQSIRGSRRLLTVSEASKRDVVSVYGTPAGRIDVAEPGVDPAFFNLTRSAPEPLILCVSTLHPHKNIERLVEAFGLLRPVFPSHRLVLAGMRGFHAEAVERKIVANNLQDTVEITGWLPRAQVLDLYRRAEIAVFPSTFEGFGIPIIEALAASVPLVTSDAAPMRDIAGDSALLFPPGDTNALQGAMAQLLSDPALRQQMAEKGRTRAAAYTWERAAGITLDSLEAAARRH